MGTPDFAIHRTTSDDWERVRELRLEMLADTPLAFADTLETALSFGEERWREWASRGSSDGRAIALAAVTVDGRWVGTMGGVVDERMPLLVSVYVTPEFRGSRSSVFDALLGGVEEWAIGHGNALRLHVHEHNPRARAAYAKRGFVPTGRTFPYVLDPSANELEMVKRLTV
ncbi:GNAT family N-acetyltransferase [Compostimonas suwonensis]|uniref:Acetyltransferase (GNAT) family protein n=1 Tax=Compostimonas suwonensis TaxID=1048394 RepID=A0A2M9BC86_9MICO|nr:GNAT family N-acetyltransferase [Compostimonas suwonensis]PJJ55570.1 acetyltransferase (GNAT) family protein [Compostimonas suwonensis]